MKSVFKSPLKFAFLCWCTLVLFGCASALKERCEKANWFEHSRDVALSGRYLEEDLLIKECKGIDSTSAVQLDLGFKSGRERYCTYENYLRRGEAGDLVNFRLCDGLVLRSMQERYANGLKSFCTAEVGFSYGASGKVYQKVCLLQAEVKFLPQYYKGRLQYLEKSISQVTQDMRMLQDLQNQIAPQINLVSHEISMLPSPQQCSQRMVYNEITKKDEARTICEEASYIRNRRSELYSQLNSLRTQYMNHSTVLSVSTANLSHLRTELTKIPIFESKLN